VTDSPDSGKRILIIEDEMDMRFFLTTLLKTSGFIPATARNGREGVEKVRDVNPDLIILDVMMPESGGALAYRQLKTDASSRNIPVIMLSAVAKNTFYHYLKMLNLDEDMDIPHPDAYVEKPADEKLLLETIRTLTA